MLCVHVISEPRTYADLYASLLADLMPVKVIDEPKSDVDVVVLLLQDNGQPRVDLVPSGLADAKVIAFSPGTELGRMRLPGEDKWRELRPFGLRRLFDEVLCGRAALPVDG